MSTTIVPLDLDSLIAAVEHARRTRPSKRVESAYEWLAEREAVEFDADSCLIVDSATWSNTRYVVNQHGCTCPARKPCWHQEAHSLVMDAQRRAQTAALSHRISAVRAKAYADVAELWA